MMRQKTVRIALGTSRRGFLASPAATPTSSVPWKENPAIMKTEMMESQNSDSPKDFAERALSPANTTRKIPAHTQPGTPGNQKSMMIPAATSSAATVMAQLNQ